MNIVGTCESMCPSKEIAERRNSKEYSIFEVDAATGEFNASLAVKIYRRAAAGVQGPDPSTIRPPRILRETLQYLFQQVLPRTDHPFDTVYRFIDDRIRAIRKDFTIQGVLNSAEPMKWIARFYILSNSLLHPSALTPLHDQQLQSCLVQIRQVQPFKEFLAYELLTGLHEPRFISLLLMQLEPTTLGDDRIQRALNAYAAVQCRDLVRFFAAFNEATFLETCVLVRILPRVWYNALESLNKAYMKREAFPLSDLERWLNLSKVETLCKLFEIQITTGDIAVNFHTQSNVLNRSNDPRVVSLAQSCLVRQVELPQTVFGQETDRSAEDQ